MIKAMFYIGYFFSYALVLPLIVTHYLSYYVWPKCRVCGHRTHPILMLHSNDRCPVCVERDLQMGVTIR